MGWLHENRIIGGNFENTINGTPLYTIFSSFYRIQAIPIMGNPFNAFFPILMIIITVLTIFNFLNKILVLFNCGIFQFGQVDIKDDVLEEGKTKLLERKKLIKEAYRKAQEQSSSTNSRNERRFLNIFSKGFMKQSKFHCDILLNDNVPLLRDVEQVGEISDNSSTPSPMMKQNKPIKLGSFTEKIGSFSNLFKKYTIRVSIEEG